MKSIDQLYPDLANRPFANDDAARLRYLDRVLKHIVALSAAGAKPERIRESAEEALGHRKVLETSFAISSA